MNFGKNEGFMVLHFGLDIESMIYGHQFKKKKVFRKKNFIEKIDNFFSDFAIFMICMIWGHFLDP